MDGKEERGALGDKMFVRMKGNESLKRATDILTYICMSIHTSK